MAKHYARLFGWLPVLEGGLAAGAVYLAVFIRLGTDPETIALSVGPIWPEAAVFAGVLLITMTAVGLYNRRLRDGIEGILVRIVLAFVAAAMLLSVVYYAFIDILLGRGILALAMVMAFLGVVIIRAQVLRMARDEGRKRRVVVLGAGNRAEVLVRLRRRTDFIGLRIVGYVPYPGDQRSVPEEKQIAVDGPLADWAVEQRIEEVVVAPDERRQNLDMHQLLLCRARGIAVTDLHTFYERETGRLSVDAMLPSWLAFAPGAKPGFLGDQEKRLFDIVISLVLLVVAAPIALLAALAIWVDSGFRGPILYRQTRVGANDREFDVLKFRTMRTDAEKDGRALWASAGDPRITRVGGFLRRCRIDELPQVWNVLRGDMSFVGPRPERPEFVRQLEQTFPHYGNRHRVKPGLTGWAQISYPYGATERDAFEKLQYDLYYVKNRSIYLDLVILLHTAEVVLWGRGAR